MDRVEFEGHPLWAAVQELQDLLTQADEVAAPEHYRMLDQVRYEQLRYVIRRIRSRRPPAEATEAARTKLDRLHGHVRAAGVELAAYLSDHGGAHLTVAVGLIEGALLDLGVRGRKSRQPAVLRQAAPKPKSKQLSAARVRGAVEKPKQQQQQPTSMPTAGGPPSTPTDTAPTIRLRRARHARRGFDRSLVSGIGIVAVIAAAIGSVLGSSSAGGSGPGIAAKGASAACTVLRVVTPSSYEPALDAVADDLASGDDCVYLDLTVADGRDAASAVHRQDAHVWIADDEGWLACAGVEGSGADRSPTLATSPVLFVSSSSMATDVGHAGGGWSGLAGLINSDASVRIVTAAPAESGDGMVALAGLGDAVRGTPGLDPALVLDLAHRRYRSTPHLAGSNIAPDEIALVPEHLLGDAADPQGVVTVPKDRTVLMRYSWHATRTDADAASIRAARRRLLTTLTEGATAEQARVAAHLRDAQRRPPATASDGVWGDRELAPPNARLNADRVDRVMATWYADDRRADVLVVVDGSAAMAEPVRGSRRPLIALVRSNLLRLAARMPDGARLGVWGFGARFGGARDYGVVDPLRPLTPTHRSGLGAALYDRLVARDRGDGFYDAVAAAYRSARSDPRSDGDLRVMVLTAGSYEGDRGSLSERDLHRILARPTNPDRPVELTVVKVGQGPTKTLDHALRPSDGKVETVADADGVVAAFARLAVGDLHP